MVSRKSTGRNANVSRRTAGKTPSSRSGHAPRLLLAVYAAALFAVTLAWQPASPHTLSRLCTIESLVARGEFNIDNPPFDTIDKVLVNGHYYSHQPPLHAVVGAIAYAPVRAAGFWIGYDWSWAAGLVAFAVNGLSVIGAVVCFFRSLQWTGIGESDRLRLTASLAVGTLLLSYAATVNAHSVVASWTFLGFAALWRARREPVRRALYAALGGLGLGAAGAVEHPAILFAAAGLAYVLAIPAMRRLAPLYLAPCILFTAGTLYYYYALSGSVRPFASRAELFDYPGSPWGTTFQLSGVEWNAPAFAMRYGLECLFGPRGFLVFNPLSWLAIYGVVREVVRRGAFAIEASAAGAGAVAYAASYFFLSTNFGGSCYSVRWLVATIPCTLFFAFVWLEEARAGWRKAAFAILFLAGTIMAAGGVIGVWWAQDAGYFQAVANISRLGALPQPTHLPSQ